MIKFLIDVFCKDTVIGLCRIEPKRKKRRSSFRKKEYSPLFQERRECKFGYNLGFTDPIACRL